MLRSPPCVLVFAGVDPSGGAGVYADVQASAGVGAHALAVVTVLTVQDSNRVYAIHALAPEQVSAQAEALIAAIPIAAVKIGIIGSRANALCIAALVQRLRAVQPALPVVLDPVLASGLGDALTTGDALAAIEPLLAHATLLTPNLPEAIALCSGATDPAEQAIELFGRGVQHVLIKGGHGHGKAVVNRLLSANGERFTWEWPRLPGAFHGSGCTLASAIAGYLAQRVPMRHACDRGQQFCQAALDQAFSIAPGQLIPGRSWRKRA
ncbi:MAG: hydroxymethylpyrimidine/phosphomethylpyrimidine kinase [Burkholderiaceae bacterium]